MEFIESIGVRLREEREALGMSQTEFAAVAEKAGVSGSTRQSQSLYEKGKRTPDAGYLAAIAAEGADVLYILTGQRVAPVAPALSRREAALLDNYRHSSPDGQEAVERTASALAQPKVGKKLA